MSSTRVNGVVLESIPLNRQLKNWVLKRWDWLTEHNGTPYACSDFKKAKEVLMGYRADPERIKHKSSWLEAFPWHTNGWVHMIFDYMDSQPEKILQLLKIYCGLGEPVVTVPQAEEQQHRVLQEAGQVDSTTPAFLIQWLDFASTEWKDDELRYLYSQAQLGWGSQSYVRFAHRHSYREWKHYYQKWHGILTRWVLISDDSKELCDRLQNREPVPAMYADYQLTDLGPTSSLDDDLWQLANMASPPFWGFGPDAKPPLTPASRRYVMSRLAPEMELVFEAMLDGDYPVSKPAITDGLYVGHIHHIPKKGSEKRRSIAVPNRFIQLGLVPVALQLEKFVKNLPSDCTTDQSKMDRKIQSRLADQQGSYVGSVDLSQATDHLPFAWFCTIWNRVFATRQLSQEVQSSWKLFVEVSNAPWDNGGYMDKWTTGQPLGSLPSFLCLAITHNLLLEALSFTLGYSGSPYAVLGDDSVEFSRKLRAAYIQLMQNAGVPLSLQKSYEGHLVEFAGKVFVTNMAPFYTTDQRPITWNSLFDYQWATGVYIKPGILPKAIWKRWVETCSKAFGNLVSQAEAKRLYRLAFLSGISPRGSSVPCWEEDELLVPMLLRVIDTEENEPDPEYYSGMAIVAGHPLNYLGYSGIGSDTMKKRWFKPESRWFRDKYRPVTTDKLANCAGLTLKDAVPSTEII